MRCDNRGNRFPASSGGGQTTSTASGNRIVSATHAEGGGVIFMPLGFVETSGGGMISVRAQSMGPAVVHVAAVDSDNVGNRGRRGSGGNSSGGRRRKGNNGTGGNWMGTRMGKVAA